MTGVDSMIRIGIVSSVDGLKARVYFPDQGNMVSDWLFVLQYPNMPVTGDTSGAAGHSHSVDGVVGTWAPDVNAKVLCLFPPGTDTDGYILGVIP